MTDKRKNRPEESAGAAKRTEGLVRPSASPRDDRLEDDKEHERLEPGLDAEGAGGAGADPKKAAARDRAR